MTLTHTELKAMSHAQFQVIYDGPSLVDNTMDVRDLAPALLAIGELLEAANGAMNQERASVSVSVKGSFKTGCFGIDFIVNQSIFQQIQDIFSNPPVAAAVNLLTALGFITGGKGLVDLIIWLRGRKPKRIKIIENGTCEVYVDDEHKIVEQRIIDLYRNLKLRKAFEAALKPLTMEGIDSFSVAHEETKFVVISKEQVPYFISPPVEDELLDKADSIVTLQFVSVSFREENKWRFTDGGAPFYAAMEDKNFLRRVQDNEVSFSKGDLLKVKLIKQQWLSGERMHTDYEIIEVLEHRRAAVQINIPMDNSE